MKSNRRTIADIPIYFGLVVLLIAFLGVQAWVGYWIDAPKHTKFRVLFNLLLSGFALDGTVFVITIHRISDNDHPGVSGVLSSFVPPDPSVYIYVGPPVYIFA